MDSSALGAAQREPSKQLEMVLVLCSGRKDEACMSPSVHTRHFSRSESLLPSCPQQYLTLAARVPPTHECPHSPSGWFSYSPLFPRADLTQLPL
jgi:hypothetical protein